MDFSSFIVQKKRNAPQNGAVFQSKARLEYSVFSCFSDAELQNGFSRNLDGFTGSRVAALTCSAVNFNQLADTRNREAVCGTFVSELGEAFKSVFCLSFRNVSFA